MQESKKILPISEPGHDRSPKPPPPLALTTARLRISLKEGERQNGSQRLPNRHYQRMNGRRPNGRNRPAARRSQPSTVRTHGVETSPADDRAENPSTWQANNPMPNSSSDIPRMKRTAERQAGNCRDEGTAQECQPQSGLSGVGHDALTPVRVANSGARGERKGGGKSGRPRPRRCQPNTASGTPHTNPRRTQISTAQPLMRRQFTPTTAHPKFAATNY